MLFLRFFILTVNYIHVIICIMKHKSQKTYITKLLGRYPFKYRYEMLAKELGVTTRSIRYYEKGVVPSEPIRKLIKMVLNS